MEVFRSSFVFDCMFSLFQKTRNKQQDTTQAMKLSSNLTIIALPVLANAWSLGPYVGVRFSPMAIYSPSEVLDYQMTAFDSLLELSRRHSFHRYDFAQSYPRYQIVNNDEKFQLTVDLPGHKVEDIQVSFDHNGQVLSLSGKRLQKSSDGGEWDSRFSKSFSLDPVVVVDKITADLKDGVLTIEVPKDAKRAETMVRQIPVTYSDSRTNSQPKLHKAPVINESTDHVELEEAMPVAVTSQDK